MKKIIVILIIIQFLSACSKQYDQIIDFSSKAEIKDIPLNEERNLYFGDLHVHTKYSFDAYLLGTTVTPDMSYRFAKGETISNGVRDMTLEEPLDFYAVTDHAILLGMASLWADPTSNIGKHPKAKPYHNLNRPENLIPESAFDRFLLFNTIRGSDGGFPSERGSILDLIRAFFAQNFIFASAAYDHDEHLSAWNKIMEAAEEHNDPGKFTTFNAYEWTVRSQEPESGSYHRNVIFKSSKAPKRPFSSFDSINPEELWNWMDGLRSNGLDSLAIPHNPNGSNGQVFKKYKFDGSPIDKDYSDQRMRNEPIVEITQIKGTSETHPRLSPQDKWADFEIVNSRKGKRTSYSEPDGSYVRQGLQRGLALEHEERGNPFKIGFIGSTDTHNGAYIFQESDSAGTAAILTSPMIRGSIPIPEELLTDEVKNLDMTVEEDQGFYSGSEVISNSVGGLAAVWAKANTRDSIFEALSNKETYATSGTRIRLRFFAGDNLLNLNLNDDELITKVYESGVAMGGDLILPKTKKPSFVVWAQKDKNGAPLQRIQIIKGYYSEEDRETKEQLIDVICSDGLKPDPVSKLCASNNASVNLDTCEFSQDKGASELKTSWVDEEYDPNIETFYYLRVLENPTCRWSTWDAIKNNYAPREGVDKIIQERAWSSPIWVSSN
ncbi:MAG: DUF3604 domain-containing protein [Gammaproteobacteria bacterium]|nr:MAG: DUF3604 domain-containing protein [Gammaproteobacteria bacterium]